MFEETNRILNKIIEANILDDKDIATIERGLKFQEMEDVMLNESLGLTKTNVFDFEHQIYKINKPVRIAYCKNCRNCLKTTSMSGGLKCTSYSCARKSTYTYALNTCEFFEAAEE